MTNFQVERNWLDKEATHATQIIWMSRNGFVRNNRRKCQWQHIFIYFLRCGHSFTSNTLRMGLNLFVYRLPFLVTFLAYERVSGEWIRNSTRSKNWGWSHRNRGFLLRNSQQSSMFCLPGNSIKLIFVHRINAKYAFVSLAFYTLPIMSCHCFSLIPLQKLYFHCFNWYTIVAEVKSKSDRA